MGGCGRRDTARTNRATNTRMICTRNSVNIHSGNVAYILEHTSDEWKSAAGGERGGEGGGGGCTHVMHGCSRKGGRGVGGRK